MLNKPRDRPTNRRFLLAHAIIGLQLSSSKQCTTSAHTVERVYLMGFVNCTLVRCPYHAWTYDLEGKLLGIAQPKLFPDLDKSAIRLLPARVDTWGGFIFVNPDPQGESLIDYLAGSPAYLQQYDQPWEELRQVTRWSYSESLNWKFIALELRGGLPLLNGSSPESVNV